MLLTEKYMARSRSTLPPELEALSKNLYAVIWSLVEGNPRIQILANKKAIGSDGSPLLWFLIDHYDGNIDQIICYSRQKFDKLEGSIKN